MARAQPRARMPHKSYKAREKERHTPHNSPNKHTQMLLLLSHIPLMRGPAPLCPLVHRDILTPSPHNGAKDARPVLCICVQRAPSPTPAPTPAPTTVLSGAMRRLSVPGAY